MQGNISIGSAQQFLAQMLHFHMMHQFSVGCISTVRHAANIKGTTGRLYGGTGLTIWMIFHFILIHRYHTHRTNWGADSR